MSEATKAASPFAKQFKAMHASGTKAVELVHEVGVQVLEHFQLHQDATLVNSYFLALPPGMNYKAMTLWLLEYAALRLNTGPHKEVEPFKFHKDKGTDLEGAKAHPWYTMAGAEKPKAANVLDIKAAMLHLVKRAAKADKLDGNFEALRQAAISLGVSDSELPSKTDAALADAQAAIGKAKASRAKATPETDPLEHSS